jgi:L-ascorbate metabolism protein UlaG (beta-lactamase superfamily)
MRVEWYGQSAFLLSGEHEVFVDPFGGALAVLASRGLVFDYPPIVDVRADLLLVTHEHGDHNGVEVVAGEPFVIRSTAGSFDTEFGAVLAVASEHDDAAGTQRGPNTIFRFDLGGLACCHLGDLGQPSLRPEQRAALGDVDVLFVPVGDGPTIGGTRAADVVRDLRPRLVIPMHYRTDAVNFLDPPDAFLEALGIEPTRLDASAFEVDAVIGSAESPSVVLLAPPIA